MEDKKITKELARGGFIGIASYLFLKPANMITTILIARFLGPEAFGLYSLGLSILIIINILTNLGLTQGIVRFVSIARSSDSKEKIKGIFFGSNIISLVFSFLVTFLLIYYSDWISLTFFQNKSLSPVLILLSLTIPINTIYVYAGALTQAFKRIDFQNIIINIVRPASYLLLLVLVFILDTSLDNVLYANLISTIVTAVVGFYLILKIFPEITDFSVKPDYEYKKLLGFSLPTLFTGFTAILLLRIDRLMIGYFMNEASVGIYSAAASAAINVTIFLNPFAMIFSPIASELYDAEKRSELKQAFQDVSRWLITFTLPVLFIFIGFSNEILLMFGEEFVIGSTVLMIISISQLINVSTGPVGIVLKMTGHQMVDFWISVLVLIINIILNLVLIPMYGLVGASIATASSIAITNCLRMLMVYKFHGFLPYKLATLKPIFSILIISAVFYLLNDLFEFQLILKITSGILAIGLFVLFIYLMKLENNDYFILNALKKKFFRTKKAINKQKS